MVGLLLSLGLLAAAMAFTVGVKAVLVPLAKFEEEKPATPIPAPHILKKSRPAVAPKRASR